MPVRWVTLLVAVALFGVAYVNSPERRAAAAYQEYWDARLIGDAERICALKRPEDLRDSKLYTPMERCVNDERRRMTFAQAREIQRRFGGFKAVTLEVDGEVAQVSMRGGDCTFFVFDGAMERTDDGRWRTSGRYSSGSFGYGPVCHEHDALPPAKEFLGLTG